MKNYILPFILLLCISEVKAQKPSLKLDSYLTWPNAFSPELSGDGKYAFFTVFNEPVGESTFVLVETNNNKTIRIQGLTEAKFSPNDHLVLGKLPNDTLVKINLDTKVLEKISNVKTYQGFEYNGQEWIAILKRDAEKTLVLSTTNNKVVFQIKNVQSFVISSNGNFLIIEDAANNKIRSFDLMSGRDMTIFDGVATNIIFSPNGNQLAFMVKTPKGKQIWQCTVGKMASLLIEQNDLDLEDKGLIIDNSDLWRYSKDGELLFFTLSKFLGNNDHPNFTIWSYEDAYLKSDALQLSKSIVETRNYAAYIDLHTKKVKQLTTGDQRLISFPSKNDSVFLVKESFGRAEEAAFINSAKISYYLGATNSGQLTALKRNSSIELEPIILSPQGKYVVYFDSDSSSYCSYNIASKAIVNLTKGIKTSFLNIDFDGYPSSIIPPVGIAGWTENDKQVLISSAHDIWMIDSRGKGEAKNLTSNKAAIADLVYYPVFGKSDDVIVDNQKLLVSCFNLDTKDYGFSEIHLKDKIIVKKLSSLPIYSGDIRRIYSKPDLIKAKRSNSYLINLSKANEYPNFYYSKDLITFKNISNLAPQKQFNWMSAELHHFKNQIGQQIDGVLYRPEDFDSTRKYPVIFNYYTKMSNELNLFERPELGGGDINVAQLVSNGYLVFRVDIYPQIGHSGEAALNSVLAAANYLSKYTYVDTLKMGVAGHSFGGFETNYIISHTARFAAAVSAAGVSDMISNYNTIWGNYGFSFNNYTLFGPPLMYKKLTEERDIYIKNSPILYANQITTPLLMMHNAKDPNVPFEQSSSFFIQLRSLKKPVWLISFKDEGHVLEDNQNKIEYYRHINDFFGYYLKNQSKPKWMTEPIRGIK